MNNLIKLFVKHHVLLLFMFLEIIAAVFVFQGKNFHRSAFISSANSISGNTYGVLQNFSEYVNLKQDNKILAVENAQLRSQSISSLKSLTHNYYVKNDSVFKQQFTYKVGKVVNNSTRTKLNNFMTINLGKNDGVMAEMGVIGSKGAIGFVGAVSDNYATIFTFLNKKTKIFTRIIRNKAVGTMTWDGEDVNYGVILDIPVTTEVLIGDTIITSGFSSIYPAGLNMGVVEEIGKTKGNQTHKVKVKLSEDYNSLTHIYVVENLMKNELDSLAIIQNKLNAEGPY